VSSYFQSTCCKWLERQREHLQPAPASSRLEAGSVPVPKNLLFVWQADEDAKLAAEAQEKMSLNDYNADPAVLAVRELAGVPDGYNPKKVTSKLKQLGFEDHPAKRARLVYLVRLQANPTLAITYCLCWLQTSRSCCNSAKYVQVQSFGDTRTLPPSGCFPRRLRSVSCDHSVLISTSACRRCLATWARTSWGRRSRRTPRCCRPRPARTLPSRCTSIAASGPLPWSPCWMACSTFLAAKRHRRTSTVAGWGLVAFETAQACTAQQDELLVSDRALYTACLDNLRYARLSPRL
jgi:hypothetical protein